MFIIFEMFCIGLAARAYYRRHVGEMPPDVEVITENMADTATAFNSADNAVSADSFKNGVLVQREAEGTTHPNDITLTTTTKQILTDPGPNDVRVGIDNPVYEGHVPAGRSPSICGMAGSLAGTPTEEKTIHIQATEDSSEIWPACALPVDEPWYFSVLAVLNNDNNCGFKTLKGLLWKWCSWLTCVY